MIPVTRLNHAIALGVLSCIAVLASGGRGARRPSRCDLRDDELTRSTVDARNRRASS